MSQPPAFTACIGEFIGKVTRPVYDPSMLSPQQQDFKEFVSYWQVINAVLGLGTVAIIFVPLIIISVLSIVGIPMVPVILGGVCVQVFIIIGRSYVGWFCIVKRNACCGHIGFAIWAVIYGFGPVLQLIEASKEGNKNGGTGICGMIVGLICMVPSFACCYGCVMLFLGNSQRRVSMPSGDARASQTVVHPTAPAPSAELSHDPEAALPVETNAR
eukprot:CAMPEP_0171273484 /NCGR_PEP_ID=MMETSP0790-20130122/62310_1 /TAXON_ID=2925 /ORGANISM="Alexandrium catenella, Strain OF101" /LENGTH=214 /DNA_ID=CAMNT_0011742477 /DNA_START=80 /DNA_END=724 /DNA_ORIENTATION=+